jgi:hypothetical protein
MHKSAVTANWILPAHTTILGGSSSIIANNDVIAKIIKDNQKMDFMDAPIPTHI